MDPKYVESRAIPGHQGTDQILQVVLKSANKDDSNLAREIHHHRQFIHPHIARLYEVIVTENLVWLVLEYCPGKEGGLAKSRKGLANNMKATSCTTIC